MKGLREYTGEMKWKSDYEKENTDGLRKTTVRSGGMRKKDR